MTDLMYELPSDETVGSCRVTRAVVEDGARPELVYRELFG